MTYSFFWMATVRSGGFSQPKRLKAEPGGPRGQLYNLREDTGETRNLYGDKPEVVVRLEALLGEITSGEQTRP